MPVVELRLVLDNWLAVRRDSSRSLQYPKSDPVSFPATTSEGTDAVQRSSQYDSVDCNLEYLFLSTIENGSRQSFDTDTAQHQLEKLSSPLPVAAQPGRSGAHENAQRHNFFVTVDGYS
jgi:hypothetical protein